MVRDTVAFLVGERSPGVRGLRALLRRLQARPRLRGRAAQDGVRCRGERRRPVRHQRRDAPAGDPPHRSPTCCERSGVRLGIHCQDDTSCAVANTLAAVEAGVTHVQCTANGYGERTGNADLFSVVVLASSSSWASRRCPPGNLREAKRISHALADIANLPPDTHQAYVGVSSFAHKAGLHASALKVNEALYSHIDPRLVGNDTRILVTEMAGRATVELKGRELGVDIASDSGGAGARRREGQGPRGRRAGPTRPPTPPSSCSCATSCPGERRRYFDVESWRAIVSPHGQRRRPRLGGHRQDPRGRPADRPGGGGQRPGQRPGQRAARRARADLSGGRRHGAGRLQGPHRARAPRAPTR